MFLFQGTFFISIEPLRDVLLYSLANIHYFLVFKSLFFFFHFLIYFMLTPSIDIFYFPRIHWMRKWNIELLVLLFVSFDRVYYGHEFTFSAYHRWKLRSIQDLKCSLKSVLTFSDLRSLERIWSWRTRFHKLQGILAVFFSNCSDLWCKARRSSGSKPQKGFS